MAIIYTYPAIGTPEDSDIMLISDVSLPNNATRNITLSNLATFINAKVDLDFIGDGGSGDVNLSTQALSILGTANEVTTAASGETLTIGVEVDAIINDYDIVTGNGPGDSLPVWNVGGGTISGSIITQNLTPHEAFIDGAVTINNSTTNETLGLNSLSTASGGNYIHAKKSNGSDQWVLGSNSASDDRVVLKQYNPANMIFTNTSGDAMVIASNGNVGIGTTTVNAKLHVAGNAIVTGSVSAYSDFVGNLLGNVNGNVTGNVTGNLVNGSLSNITSLSVTGTGDSYFAGKVGIGIVAPQRELDVNGGVRVRGPLDLFQQNDNTLAGQDAGNWYNITGSKNTAFGKNSQSVQVGGSQNTSVGYNSMAAATAGNFNTAVGDSAMSLNDGGSFNTAVGSRALQDQEAGQGNTAIGYQSLDNKDESNFNTAVGYNSLFNVSTGFKNVGIGDSVGLTLSTGNKNVLIGSNANVAAPNDANSIVIGADVTGNGTNTATIGNASITALHVGGNNASIVLKSPNGTAYKITVNNTGSLVVIPA